MPTMGKTCTKVLENVVRGVEPVTPNVAAKRRRKRAGAGAGAGAAGPAPVQDQYSAFLRNMQYRGGSYAILKCFEHHPIGTKLGKAQIIKQAQPHCDEAMAPNFFAGRLFAGWKSIETVVKHGLVLKTSMKTHNARNGWRGCLPDIYVLDHSGAAFIRRMNARFHGGGGGGGGGGAGTGRGAGAAGLAGAGGGGGGGGAGAGAAYGAGPPIGFSSKWRDQGAGETGDELETFVRNNRSTVGANTEFRGLSKQKRSKMHKECDRLERVYSVTLAHASHGQGRGRVLTVTIAGSNGGGDGGGGNDLQQHHHLTTPIAAGIPGRTLGGGGAAAGGTAQKLAALAAERRAHAAGSASAASMRKMAKVKRGGNDGFDNGGNGRSDGHDGDSDDDMKQAIMLSLQKTRPAAAAALPDSSHSSHSPWICSRCTCENESNAFACCACDAWRPGLSTGSGAGAGAGAGDGNNADIDDADDDGGINLVDSGEDSDKNFAADLKRAMANSVQSTSGKTRRRRSPSPHGDGNQEPPHRPQQRQAYKRRKKAADSTTPATPPTPLTTAALSTTSNVWSCSQCTLENASTASKCEVCGAAKPAPAQPVAARKRKPNPKQSRAAAAAALPAQERYAGLSSDSDDPFDSNEDLIDLTETVAAVADGGGGGGGGGSAPPTPALTRKRSAHLQEQHQHHHRQQLSRQLGRQLHRSDSIIDLTEADKTPPPTPALTRKRSAHLQQSVQFIDSDSDSDISLLTDDDDDDADDARIGGNGKARASAVGAMGKRPVAAKTLSRTLSIEIIEPPLVQTPKAKRTSGGGGGGGGGGSSAAAASASSHITIVDDADSDATTDVDDDAEADDGRDGGELVLIVDERERGRNTNPLGIYLNVKAMLETAARLETRRETLQLADFAWARRRTLGAGGDEVLEMTDVAIERKRMGDLVGRSAKVSDES